MLNLHILQAVGLGDLDYYGESFRWTKATCSDRPCLSESSQLLLADEPTAALDKKSGRDVVELMQGLAKERGLQF